MKKTRSTKSALISSVLALFLCITMLLGTTFAWFTDSVTSANNIIKSGNLDVELYYAEGTEALDDKTEWKNAANVAIFDYNNWEPGYTDAKHTKIANEGSLDLHYRLAIVPNGEVTKLAEVIDVYYADGGKQVADRSDVDTMTKRGTLAELINTGIADGTLEDGKEYVSTIVLKMREDAGNEYQNLSIGDSFSIVLFATQLDSEIDSIDNQYDVDAVPVADTAAAQAALDNAVPGTTIQLDAGVNYGTLYLRPSANADVTKTVDWIGNNYGWETYSLYENITILGAPGATVDAIEIEGGTYYHTEHSQDDAYPVMLSLVELKNVVIDGVTFTGKGGYDPQGYGNVINLSGHGIKVDGLTLKNCVLNNKENNARLIYKTEGTTYVHNYAYGGETYTFVPSLKDITVTGCTFNGGYMGMELRETENVTVTNNVFNDVASRDMLLPTNTGCTYSGNVTITGNVSNRGGNRFVRMAGAGSANVVIKDNTINDNLGEDYDAIKVSDVTTGSLTVENNTVTHAIADATSFAYALDKANGDVYRVLNDFVVPSGVSFTLAADKAATIDLAGHTISLVDAGTEFTNHGMILNSGDLTITDSVGGGKLSFKYVGTNLELTYAAYTIRTLPGSTLTVKGGTIENLTYDSAIIAYAIDIMTNGGNGDVTATIEGGNISSLRQAIRVFANSTTDIGTLSISGGDIYGRVIIQNASAKDNLAALNITGGTFTANEYKEDAIYVGGTPGASMTSMKPVISGGVFTGVINISAFNNKCITGGTFSDFSVLNHLADGADITIKLNGDLTLNQTATIPANATVTLDLVGHTISQEKGDITTSYAMIDNKGTLTIEDSVGNGKISFADTTPYTTDIGWASNTIRNTGVLTINGGTIENNTSVAVMSFSYPHAIDCYQGSVTTINGGTVKSANYDSIRMFCNSATLATELNINGGTIVNRISFQDPNGSVAGYGILNITGGTFLSTDNVNANVRLLNFSNVGGNMKATVTGGTFDKGFKTQNHASATIQTSDWLTYTGANVAG